MPRTISEDDIYLVESLYCQGFSPTEIKKETGISYNVIYFYTRIKEMGFDSRYNYDKYLSRKRQRRKANRILGRLIKYRLRKLKRERYWLANKADISNTSVSNYSTGRILPRENIRRKIFSALGLPHKTLEDFL